RRRVRAARRPGPGGHGGGGAPRRAEGAGRAQALARGPRAAPRARLPAAPRPPAPLRSRARPRALPLRVDPARRVEGARPARAGPVGEVGLALDARRRGLAARARLLRARARGRRLPRPLAPPPGGRARLAAPPRER